MRYISSLSGSSVTTVGVTGAESDGVTLFYLQKTDNLFSHRHHPHPLRLPSDRFTSTLCKIQPQNILYCRQGVTPSMVSPGAVRPALSPRDATAQWRDFGETCHKTNICHVSWNC